MYDKDLQQNIVIEKLNVINISSTIDEPSVYNIQGGERLELVISNPGFLLECHFTYSTLCIYVYFAVPLFPRSSSEDLYFIVQDL